MFIFGYLIQRLDFTMFTPKSTDTCARHGLPHGQRRTWREYRRPVTSSFAVEDGCTENFVQDAAYVEPQRELVELIIRNNHRHRLPTSAHGVVVTLHTYLHAEAVGHVNHHGGTVTVRAHTVRIAHHIRAEGTEGQAVGNLIFQHPRRVEHLTAEVRHRHLHGIHLDLEVQPVA